MNRYIELNNMEDDYPSLISQIESFYTEPFSLHIETKNISNVSFTMVINFSIFLLKLKQREPQYLTHTTIRVYSDTIYNMLYYLFTYLSRPIAPVKVLQYDKNELKQIYTFLP